MSNSTDDDSSDSSSEYMVSLDKINLNSSFFSQNTTKSNLTSSQADTEDESGNDDDFKDVTDEASAEMFTQVLKNLENSQKYEQCNEDPMDCEPAAQDSPAKLEKGKAIQAKPHVRQSNVLSKEITDLLLQGEAGTLASPADDEESDEEYKEEEGTSSGYTIPKEGVKITLPGTGFMVKRKKNGKTVDTFLREIINRIKSNQVLIHKVGLLCWLGYGFHLNRLINDGEIMLAVQKLVSKTQYPKGQVDVLYLEKFTKWFKGLFIIETAVTEETINKSGLLKRAKEKKLLNYKELVLLFIATVRTMGIRCRLIISLHPPDLKLHKDQLPKTKAELDREKERKETKKEKESTGEEKGKSKSKSTKDTKVKIGKQKKSKGKDSSKTEGSPSKVVAENSPEGEKNAKLEARKKAATVLQAKLSNKQNSKSKTNTTVQPTPISHRTRHALESKHNQIDTSKNEDGEKLTMARKLRSKITQNVQYAISSSAEDTPDSDKGTSKTSKETKVKASTSTTMDVDSEEEFMPKQPAKKNVSTKSVANTKKRKEKDKLLEADDTDDDPEAPKKREDLWAEIYVESERSWICISVMNEKINCVADVYRKATKPVLYVVAWNSEGSIKDVTRRYCPHWLTVTRKQRVEEKWWTESMSGFQEKDTSISKAEDEMLLQRELERPLPKTIGECKGHPLYALQRHLLKYEALYPPDCVPLGHLPTGEAIYSRYCVHTLYSRETWIKKARVVKPAQEPYKIVKAHLRYDKLSGMKLKDEKLELFGQWQTTEYVPPVAKDGIVPRNEYGNVDLFKQCMLPKGTVHIDLPALNRVARKLNIDCAPAVVGFKFGCMGAVPAFEGFVVCEEHEDTLREAWETEQIEAAKRAKEKREKRVYGNWKKLIRGLLVREKLAAKYEFESEQKPSESGKRSKYKKTDMKKMKTH